MSTQLNLRELFWWSRIVSKLFVQPAHFLDYVLINRNWNDLMLVKNVSDLRHLTMLENTRQAIIDAAIFIFNEDLSAPLEKVAENANVTRRTLHRYFKDRKELLVACKEEMQMSCRNAVVHAKERSEDPLEQLEYLLYASIDCGVKFAFLYKLHNLHDHAHDHSNKDCVRYDHTFDKIRSIIVVLQEKGIVTKELTLDWISLLFPGIVTTTIQSVSSRKSESDQLKKFAWYSFSKGIGL